jgi:hypothetical protein
VMNQVRLDMPAFYSRNGVGPSARQPKVTPE